MIISTFCFIHLIILYYVIIKLREGWIKRTNYLKTKHYDLCVIDNMDNIDNIHSPAIKPLLGSSVSPIISPVNNTPIIRNKSTVKLFNFNNNDNLEKPKLTEVKCGAPSCMNYLGEKYFMAFDKRYCSVGCRDTEINRTDPEVWLNSVYDEYEIIIIDDEY